jgi:hypothetical protein
MSDETLSDGLHTVGAPGKHAGSAAAVADAEGETREARERGEERQHGREAARGAG